MTEQNTDRSDANEDLRRKLQAAKKRNADLEESIREQEERRDLQRQLRFEENKTRDLPHIQAAEEEHGQIRVANTHDGAVVVKAPHHLAYNKYVRRMSNDKKPMDNNDFWRLVKPCIVYPDVAKVEELTEKYAGLVITLGNLVVELGRGEAEAFEGK